MLANLILTPLKNDNRWYSARPRQHLCLCCVRLTAGFEKFLEQFVALTTEVLKAAKDPDSGPRYKSKSGGKVIC